MDTDVLGSPAGVAPRVVRPLIRPLPEHWTPVRLLEAVGDIPYTLCFESGGAAGEASRWTTLAFDPLYRVALREGKLVANGRQALEGDALSNLARLWPRRVVYEPVSIEPRVTVPKVIRKEREPGAPGADGRLEEVVVWFEPWKRPCGAPSMLPDAS